MPRSGNSSMLGGNNGLSIPICAGVKSPDAKSICRSLMPNRILSGNWSPATGISFRFTEALSCIPKRNIFCFSSP
ncbi:MAG: hypothetical protein RR212_04635 [Bacteroidales bacterium]